MSKLKELEKSVEGLPPEELSRFRAWFVEFDQRAWDKQIEADSRSGKLDAMAAQATADYKAGKARKI
jgi:hypothetical protein